MTGKLSFLRRTGLVVLAALLVAAATGAHKEAKATQEGEARKDVVYLCSCGPDCKCNAVSTQPGKCGCGKELGWGHVVKLEGDVALVCQCDTGCKCSIDAKDPKKCGCGKDLKRVNLKGSGVYFCNCGGSCTCNNVSDKPGKCGCGMELKKSD